MNPYVIQGGRHGKERLRLLSSVMGPTTERLLNRIGLRPGLHGLDLGCGGGDVTRELARRVGPAGRVVGIDRDETILQLDREELQSDPLPNLSFRAGDAEDLQEQASYDLVYARFLLTHLPRRDRALQGMLRALRPGGVVVIEEVDFGGHFCHPDCPAFRRYVELYQQVVLRRGGDPFLGPKLPRMLIEAGVRDVQVEVVQPAFLEGPGKLIAAVTLERTADSIRDTGLASAEEMGRLIGELHAAAADARQLLSLPRVFQVWGRLAVSPAGA
jgi:ubiquinone/menaquinone biosynthesis C-methylase UbiE